MVVSSVLVHSIRARKRIELAQRWLASRSGSTGLNAMELDTAEWHGWSVMGFNLHVGELPSRKQVVLYTMINDGTTIHPLAYFKTPEDARICLDFLDKLATSRFVLDTLEKV